MRDHTERNARHNPARALALADWEGLDFGELGTPPNKVERPRGMLRVMLAQSASLRDEPLNQDYGTDSEELALYAEEITLYLVRFMTTQRAYGEAALQHLKQKREMAGGEGPAIQ